MPPMYCPHLQRCPQHSAVFFFVDFDSNLPTSSVSSHSFVHTEVVFLPIKTYKLRCTFVTPMDSISKVGIATHNIQKMHVTYKWQIVISKSWFHIHTHTHPNIRHPRPYNLQLTGNIRTQHTFIIVITNQQIFKMKLKTWEEILVLYFGVCVCIHVYAYTNIWEKCQMSLNSF